MSERCPECGAMDCGNNLGIYLCGSRGSHYFHTFVASADCVRRQRDQWEMAAECERAEAKRLRAAAEAAKENDDGK